MNNNYFPSSHALLTIDGFGTRKRPWREHKHQSQKPVEARMPDFARRKKKAFDKQNLIQQIRQEKKRNLMARASSIQLLRTISKSKEVVREKQEEGGQQTLSRFKADPLKRQIQYLISQIEKQNRSIKQIKRSKKYNRIMELDALKTVYEEELRGLQSKVRSYRYELRKGKKERRGERARKGDVFAINGEVERRLHCQNMQLADQIQQIDDVVEAERERLSRQRREKARLMRQIYELQRQTGVVYLRENTETQEYSASSNYEGKMLTREEESEGSEEKESYGEEFEQEEEPRFSYESSCQRRVSV